MKKISWHQYFVTVMAAFVMAACNKPPRGENVIITDELLPKTGTGETFYVDTVKSWIRIKGASAGNNRPATFQLRYGQVTANKNQVTGGNFILDIASFEIRPEQNDGKLQLATGDTLEAEMFGTSEFQITNVEPYKPGRDEMPLVEGANFMVSGNLQIVNVTKNITFPARVDLDGNTLKAKANFDIDRRQWELNYGKEKTLNEGPGSQTMNVELHIEARPEDASI